MFIRTLTGKTDKERGKTMEVASTSISSSSSHSEGRTFTVIFKGQEEEGLFREPSVNVTMTLEEAEKHLERFGAMVAHSKLPEMPISDFRAKTAPGQVLWSSKHGLEVFHPTKPELVGKVTLSLSGFLLVDSNGNALAKIST